MFNHVALVACLALAPCITAKTALLLIDVQDCFTSKDTRTGSLSVSGAIDIVPIINKIRSQKKCLFDEVFLSQDYHPLKHISFASTHNVAFSDAFSIPKGTNTIQVTCLKPSSGKTADASCCLMDTAACSAHGCSCANGNPACSTTANAACTTCKSTPSSCFNMTQSLWPDHCGSWTSSAAGNDASFVSTLQRDGSEIIIQKGSNKLVDAYSAFMDNTKSLKTDLDAKLKEKGITKLYIGGIATDFCVSWTATDAIALGYDTTWISDAGKGIVTQTLSLTNLKSVTSAELLAMPCPTTGGTTSTAVTSGQGRAGLGDIALLFLLSFAYAQW